MADKLPVNSSQDIYSVLPRELQTQDAAPVRDAIIAALTAAFQTYQIRSRYSASQSDPLRATNIYLNGIASDRQVFRAADESDPSLQTRQFTLQDQVSPFAIQSVVNAIIAPYTDVLAQFIESELDCGFVSDGTATWDSFIGASPHYQDRLYPDDVLENGGYVRPQCDPGGFWAFADQNGRHFLIRLPPLDAADADFAFISDNTDASGSESDGSVISFFADGSDTAGAESDGSVTTFIYTGGLTSDELYNAVIGAVSLVKPQGYRFEIVVDPDLT